MKYTFTENELHEFVETAVSAGIKAYEAEKKRLEKATEKQAGRKIKQILKSYRSIKASITDTEGISAEADKKRRETETALKRIDRAVELFRQECEQRNRPEDLRMFRVVEKMYLAEYPYTAQEIAEAEKISPKTVYRDLGIAYEKIIFYYM